MTFARYAARFDKAVRVRSGQASQAELMLADGRNALKGEPRIEAPQVVLAVGLSGAARPGETLTILPGEYSGLPAPQISHQILRGETADASPEGQQFVVSPEDLGKVLQVVETAWNDAGSVQTTAEVTVAIAAPTSLTMTTMAVELTTDTEIPTVLCHLSTDGDQPLEWLIDDAPDHLEIDTTGARPALILVAVPPAGDYVHQLRVSNPAGSAEAAFRLIIEAPSMVPTRHVQLSRDHLEITPDTELPVDLATMTADGDAPLQWTLASGAPHVALDLSGDAPVLRLLSTPVTGAHSLRVVSGNDAGMAEARFLLTVATEIAAPSAIAIATVAADIRTDAELPLTLASMTADGSRPLDWSLTGDATGLDIDLSGVDPVLRLTAMPVAGNHSATVRAQNSAGSAEAAFAFNVSPADIAPTAVVLSETTAEVRTDAALPVVLATLSTDGSAPLEWSLVGDQQCFALDLSNEQPVLTLTVMPAAGKHDVTVRAANRAGEAQGTFGLTVTAQTVDEVMYSGAGKVEKVSREADGSLSFSLSGDGAGSYAIPAADETAGLPVILSAPTITEEPAGTWTITANGLYAAPATDPASVLYSWHVNGKEAGKGLTFTRQAWDLSAEISLAVTLMNVATVTVAQQPVRRVVVQSRTEFPMAPMHFRASEGDKVEWATSFAANSSKMMYFTRFTFLPDGADSDHRGNLFGMGVGSVEHNVGSMRCLMYAKAATGTGAVLAYLDQPLVSGDRVDVIGSLGYAEGGARKAAVMLSINGGPWKKVVRPINTHVAKLTEITKMTLGGKHQYGPNDGGVSHDQYRSVVWADVAEDPDLVADRFVMADGQLEHPGVATALFGQPLIDFYNGQNNGGSLGAPTIQGDLS